ncbi:MAG: 3-isopropylmalate dehydratase [Candidatus Omnitrophica bacterium 4484_213]|nr:MAG: 3-isopropylmalate dehydratase [Candidatus Omnitrophica bacterium 4484_213]
MKLIGYAKKFGDDVNTDLIISGRYKFSITDIKELSRHIMEDIRPNFYDEIKGKEIFIVAGRNFGCGSSREQAPLVIKSAGVKAVIANSFARIFYRNSFNIGLPLIICDTEEIKENDFLEMDLDRGILKMEDKQMIFSLPSLMKEILRAGGGMKYAQDYLYPR